MRRLKAKVVKSILCSTPDGALCTFTGVLTKIPVEVGRVVRKRINVYVASVVMVDTRQDGTRHLSWSFDTAKEARETMGWWYGHWRQALDVEE